MKKTECGASASPAKTNGTYLMITLPSFETLKVEFQKQVLRVAIDQPQTRNALSNVVRHELEQLCDFLENNEREGNNEVRVLVLQSSNGTFCAGGDIRNFQRNLAKPLPAAGERDAIALDNREFGTLLNRFNLLPQVTVCAVEGPAFGGALGLICVCDVAIAMRNARFALSETSLGVIPAQIAPFVALRVGLSQARRLALTGVRFDGGEAFAAGLVHHLCETREELTAILESTVRNILRCGPQANAVTKQLLLRVVGADRLDTLLDDAADSFAQGLRSDEGHAGVGAFLNKQTAPWVPGENK
jgi:isohexenylglutaconyl-CoA hydratase